MLRTRTTGLAAETAFWLFFSLIPLSAVGGLLAARFTESHWAQLSPVLGSLPAPVRDLVVSDLTRAVRWNGGAVGVTGCLVFAWLASSGVHAIFDALELEAGESRPWWKKRALALATCVALSLTVAALALLGPGFQSAAAHLGIRIPGLGAAGETSLFERVLRHALTLAIALGYVSGFYWVGTPPRARRNKPIFPGALLAVVLQACLSYGYTTYVTKVGGSAYTTGLAIVALTLMTLYLFALALLAGAMINNVWQATGRPVGERSA